MTKNGVKIWDRILDDANYSSYLGAVSLTSILENKYLEGYMGKCYLCDSEESDAVIIINIQSGNNILLGEAKNIILNLGQSKITYEINGKQIDKALP